MDKVTSWIKDNMSTKKGITILGSNPPIIEDESPPPIIVPTYNLEVVVDSEHPQVNNIIFDPEKNIVTAYLPEGFKLKNLKHDVVMGNIAKQRYSMSIIRACEIEYIPVEMRTCKWFTADREISEAYFIEPADTYDFDRPHRDQGICSNPKMIAQSGRPNPACISPQVHNQCQLYSLSKWEDVRGVVVEEEDKTHNVVIQKIRKGPGIIFFRIVNREVNAEGETQFSAIIDEVNGTEFTENLPEVITERFNAFVDGMNIVDKLTFEQSEDPHEPYFEHVYS